MRERFSLDIHESIKALLGSEKLFGEQFYTIFFDRCPEAKNSFEGIDMGRQALVLTMALTLIEQHYTHGYAAVEQYLRHLGNRHKERMIPADMYPTWRECMLATLEEFHGPQWNDTLRTQWHDAIEGVSHSMLSGYDEHTSI